MHLFRELENIQKKVSKWDSLGHFERAVLASDHAEELKEHRYTAQTLLDEMQVRDTFFSVFRWLILLR